MATTIIDKLIVELGLDPKQFSKGTKQAATDTKTMQDQVSYSAGEMVAAIHRVAAEFVGLFLTIRGVSDLVGQFENLNENVRQLGIDSRNLDQGAAELRDWGNVAELAGGKADDAASSIQGLEKAIFNVAHGAGWSEQLTEFARINVDTGAITGHMRDFHAILLDTAKALQAQYPNSADRYQEVQKLGLQGGIGNAVVEGPAALERYYAKEKGLPQVSGADTAAAQRLAEAFTLLKQRVEAVATKILTAVEPALEGLATAFSNFLAKNQGKISQGIDDLAAWATGDGPKRVITAMTDFAQQVVDATGTIHRALHPLDNAAQGLGAVGDLAHESNQRGVQYGKIQSEIASAEKSHGLPAGLLAKTGNGPDKLGLGSANALAAIMAEQHAALGGDKADPDWTKTVAAINARVRAGAAPATQVAPAPNPTALKATQGAGASPGARATVTQAGGTPTAANGSTVTIGDIFIQTQAKDANGIAGSIDGALQRKLTVSQADGALS